MTTKYTKWTLNIPNGHKVYQKATKYTKQFSLQGVPKYSQTGIFGMKIYHLATLESSNKSLRIHKSYGYGVQKSKKLLLQGSML
jgi:hypothetical protein